jgi:hypothetical protein
MCPSCDAFAEQRTFKAPADYVAFVRRLITETSSGSLALVYGDCALEELKNAPPWPEGDEDDFLHELQCAKCGQLFQLSANVYNGRNLWEPQSPEQWADQRRHYIK